MSRILYLALVLMLTACNSSETVITAAPAASATPIPSPSAPGPITVSLDGAAARPGEYTLPPGSLVKDALEAAGGPTREADVDRLNLAQELKNGQHIHVPAIGQVLPTPTPFGVAGDGRIDINLANEELLQTLPKIGPVTAQNIVEYREQEGSFETIEEIMQVKGIGEGTYAKIENLITAGETPAQH